MLYSALLVSQHMHYFLALTQQRVRLFPKTYKSLKAVVMPVVGTYLVQKTQNEKLYMIKRVRKAMLRLVKE